VIKNDDRASIFYGSINLNSKMKSFFYNWLVCTYWT